MLLLLKVWEIGWEALLDLKSVDWKLATFKKDNKFKKWRKYSFSSGFVHLKKKVLKGYNFDLKINCIRWRRQTAEFANNKHFWKALDSLHDKYGNVFLIWQCWSCHFCTMSIMVNTVCFDSHPFWNCWICRTFPTLLCLVWRFWDSLRYKHWLHAFDSISCHFVAD